MTDLTPTPVRHTPYLTVITDRHPRQKAHRTRGHAHAALSQRVRPRYTRELGTAGWGYHYALSSDLALYEWRDDDWRLVWQGAKGDPVDRSAPPWKSAE